MGEPPWPRVRSDWGGSSTFALVSPMRPRWKRPYRGPSLRSGPDMSLWMAGASADREGSDLPPVRFRRQRRGAIPRRGPLPSVLEPDAVLQGRQGDRGRAAISGCVGGSRASAESDPGQRPDEHHRWPPPRRHRSSFSQGQAPQSHLREHGQVIATEPDGSSILPARQRPASGIEATAICPIVRIARWPRPDQMDAVCLGECPCFQQVDIDGILASPTSDSHRD
jgi:hypothetical protein